MSNDYFIPIIENTIKVAIPKAISIQVGGEGVVSGYGCFEIEFFNLSDYETLFGLGVRDFSVSTAATNPKNLFVEFRFGDKFS